MAILKLTKEELEVIRENETNYIVDTLGKDRTIGLLRPSNKKRVLNNDEATYNMVTDIIDIIIPVANTNGTPITLNLISAALGIPRQTLSDYYNTKYFDIMNAAEKEWHEKIINYIGDTLSIGRADVENLQITRRLDSSAASKSIDEINEILDDKLVKNDQTLSIKLVDDYD